MAKFDLGGAVSTHNLLANCTDPSPASAAAADNVYKSQPNLASASAIEEACQKQHLSLHGLLDRRPLVALVMEPASAMGLLTMDKFGGQDNHHDGPASSPIAGFKSSFAKECAQARGGRASSSKAARDFSPPPSPYVRPTQTSVAAASANRRFSSNLHKYRVKQQVTF